MPNGQVAQRNKSVAKQRAEKALLPAKSVLRMASLLVLVLVQVLALVLVLVLVLVLGQRQLVPHWMMRVVLCIICGSPLLSTRAVRAPFTSRVTAWRQRRHRAGAQWLCAARLLCVTSWRVLCR